MISIRKYSEIVLSLFFFVRKLKHTGKSTTDSFIVVTFQILALSHWLINWFGRFHNLFSFPAQLRCSSGFRLSRTLTLVSFVLIFSVLGRRRTIRSFRGQDSRARKVREGDVHKRYRECSGRQQVRRDKSYKLLASLSQIMDDSSLSCHYGPIHIHGAGEIWIRSFYSENSVNVIGLHQRNYAKVTGHSGFVFMETTDRELQ